MSQRERHPVFPSNGYENRRKSLNNSEFSARDVLAYDQWVYVCVAWEQKMKMISKVSSGHWMMAVSGCVSNVTMYNFQHRNQGYYKQFELYYAERLIFKQNSHGKLEKYRHVFKWFIWSVLVDQKILYDILFISLDFINVFFAFPTSNQIFWKKIHFFNFAHWKSLLVQRKHTHASIRHLLVTWHLTQANLTSWQKLVRTYQRQLHGSVFFRNYLHEINTEIFNTVSADLIHSCDRNRFVINTRIASILFPLFEIAKNSFVKCLEKRNWPFSRLVGKFIAFRWVETTQLHSICVNVPLVFAAITAS